MYHCCVVSTRACKPETFISSETRLATEITDPAGVWQKDRGGKFTNYLIAELQVQDDLGARVTQCEHFDLELELRLVMENGELGGALDVVSRSSNLVLQRHLEGQSKKLTVIDVNMATGAGMQVGGPGLRGNNVVKFRINELSKRGSKNSRYCVVFRVIGPGSERFSRNTHAHSHPITIYSKLSRHTSSSSTLPPQPTPPSSSLLTQPMPSSSPLGEIMEMMQTANGLLRSRNNSGGSNSSSNNSEEEELEERESKAALMSIQALTLDIQEKVSLLLLNASKGNDDSHAPAKAMNSPAIKGTREEVEAWYQSQTSLSLDAWVGTTAAAAAAAATPQNPSPKGDERRNT